MLKAMILVCSLASDCTQSSAVSVINMPETFTSAFMCLARAQAYIADTQLVHMGMTVRIKCEPYKEARR